VRSGTPIRIKVIPLQCRRFALSDAAQAHLAIEKGDKLGTAIVDSDR
jgi:hypothetical protein